jgi:hypothetical protein
MPPFRLHTKQILLSITREWIVANDYSLERRAIKTNLRSSPDSHSRTLADAKAEGFGLRGGLLRKKGLHVGGKI